MHGLTTRGYSQVVRELKENQGLEKSTGRNISFTAGVTSCKRWRHRRMWTTFLLTAFPQVGGLPASLICCRRNLRRESSTASPSLAASMMSAKAVLILPASKPRRMAAHRRSALEPICSAAAELQRIHG